MQGVLVETWKHHIESKGLAVPDAKHDMYGVTLKRQHASYVFSNGATYKGEWDFIDSPVVRQCMAL
jgi:hypothetical protein